MVWKEVGGIMRVQGRGAVYPRGLVLGFVDVGDWGWKLTCKFSPEERE